jgi:O-antigen/teichoic acid export membrane protein
LCRAGFGGGERLNVRLSSQALLIPTPPDAAEPFAGAAAAGPASTTKQFIRGSSLLVVGRLISIVLNFAIQVLTVRYLAKTEYGAFAYALGVVSLGSSTVLLGMGKAVPRLVPLYHEQKNYARTFGIIAIATVTIWIVGSLPAVALYAFRDRIAGGLVSDPLGLSLLLVLIALVPVEAFCALLERLVAIFARPRAIFFRRHLFAPGFKVLLVLVVMLTAGDVYLLAYGYLAAGVLSVCLYVVILVREWSRQGLLRQVRSGGIELPVRELFGFSIPLLSTELSVVLRGSIAVLMLEYFHDTAAVADYRAVLPVAGLNMLVFEAFSLLFVPVASRLFARSDRNGIADLYWQTSIWMTVLSFPVLALTTSLAAPVTVMFFGAEYANAGLLLGLLAVGYYFHAALGFNEATLRVHGKIRFIVATDVLGALFAVILGLVLIRRYGALGAAISTTLTFVLLGVAHQYGLRACDTGVRPFEWRFARVYVHVLVASAALMIVQWLIHPPMTVSILLAAAATTLLIRLTRDVVRLETTFPELLRIPVMRRLLAVRM